jgi:hypothetical protein
MGVGGVGWRRGEKEGERRRKGRCVNRMELHKDHACVCIDCVCVLLMIMMIESLWNCCTRPNAARGTVLTRCVAVLMFRDDIGGARAWLIYDSHSAHC